MTGNVERKTSGEFGTDVSCTGCVIPECLGCSLLVNELLRKSTEPSSSGNFWARYAALFAQTTAWWWRFYTCVENAVAGTEFRLVGNFQQNNMWVMLSVWCLKCCSVMEALLMQHQRRCTVVSAGGMAWEGGLAGKCCWTTVPVTPKLGRPYTTRRGYEMHISEQQNTILTKCTKMTEETHRRHGMNGNDSGAPAAVTTIKEECPNRNSHRQGGRLKFFKGNER